MATMGIRSLQGRPFINRLLHNRFYLSHVYEEYAVAMLTQHGIKCRMDRRHGSADILTESGLRIEVKSSGGYSGKTKRSASGCKKDDNVVYWDTFNVVDKIKDFSRRMKESDFFLFISVIGKCVFIVPTHEVESRHSRQWSIPWTEERLAGNFRQGMYQHRDSAATFLFHYKNAWHLLEQAERDRRQ